MIGSVLFGLLLMGLGVLTVAGGERNLREARGFHDRARPATGLLVGVRTERHNDRTTHYPVLRFQTLDGTTVETTSGVNEGPFYLWRMRGRPVPVLYDPEDPRRAHIGTPEDRRRVRSALAVIALGAAFILVGVAYLVIRLR